MVDLFQLFAIVLNNLYIFFRMVPMTYYHRVDETVNPFYAFTINFGRFHNIMQLPI